ncbi:T9SS type A sorting domain-containing protein [Putridiphycobacter roseus]|uniref:T9SS type A sorting domain-containing protein n=1 Tax=Putridiphycobacter roseus TaxID=2219161 RepID=UPI00363B129B
MRKFILFSALFFSTSLMAQYVHLEANKVNAFLSATPFLFSNINTNRAGYEVPKTNDFTGPKTIYNSSFWFGGLDNNGDLHTSINRSVNSTVQLSFGPIADDYFHPNYPLRYTKVYTVTKSEIQYHLNHFNDPGYVTPNNILDWPANSFGNGEATLLAPYFNNYGSLLYQPEDGDVPLIRGDEAAFFILNDASPFTSMTNRTPLNIEVHIMVYQYHESGNLDSTTFINLKVINRSENTYQQFKVANFTDFDIGGAEDDLAGSSSIRNLIYAYNGDNIDDAGSNPYKFGENPPACGIKLLNQTMQSAAIFLNAGNYGGGGTEDTTFWNYLNAKWGDGSPMTVGGYGFNGTIPTNYMHDGSPTDTSSSTEFSNMNSLGDRRTLLTADPIDNFGPGDIICYDFAVITSRAGGNSLTNVDSLFAVADYVQNFYDQQTNYCEDVILGENNFKQTNQALNLYPNPAQNQISLYYEGDYNLSIIDLNGKTVFEQLNNTNSVKVELDIPNGLYVVKVISEGKTNYTKLVINK